MIENSSEIKIACFHKFAFQYPNRPICYLCGYHNWWSVKFDYCEECGKTEKPHRQNGLCSKCWELQKYRKHRDLNTLYFERKRIGWLFRYFFKRKKRGGGYFIAKIDNKICDLPLKISFVKNREKDFSLYWLAVERMRKMLNE